MDKYKTDESQLLKLKDGDKKLLQQLYNEWREPFLLFIIRRFQCSMESAEEIYPETMSRFYFNIVDGKLSTPLESSLKTYAFGIGKNLFYKRFFNKYTEQTVLDNEFPDAGQKAEVLELYEYEDQKQLVKQLLNAIGEKCRTLLELFYIKGFSSEAIRVEMDIPTDGAVRKRRFDCLKKLRNLMGIEAKS